MELVILKLTSGHFKQTSGHLKLTSGHLELTSGHLELTSGHLELTSGQLVRLTSTRECTDGQSAITGEDRRYQVLTLTKPVVSIWFGTSAIDIKSIEVSDTDLW